MPSRDSCLQPDTRNLYGGLGNVFENPPAPNEPTASCLGNGCARSLTATPLFSVGRRASKPRYVQHCRLGLFQDSDFAAAGVLEKRGFAVESAANRVCREAGGRVVPNGLGERRVGILADGLPLFHGAQLAVDTLVAPRPRYADVDGVVLEEAKRRNVSTLNSQEGTAEHSWWSFARTPRCVGFKRGDTNHIRFAIVITRSDEDLTNFVIYFVSCVQKRNTCWRP